MRFYLAKRESTHKSIKRIFVDLINENILLLSLEGDNVDKSIHDARKNFKKLRAVLRLVRSDLSPHFYKTHNTHFRNLSRKIAGLRDSFIIIETLEKLLSENNRKLEEYDSLISYLKNDYFETKNRILFEENSPLSVISSLQFSLNEFENMPLISDGFDTLELGIENIYSKGKYFLNTTYSIPTSEVFHEWRKNVKYLWHLLQIIQPINYRRLKKLTKDFKILSDFIGDEHDLFELQNTLLAKNIEDLQLIQMIKAKQFSLRADAWKLGEKLYSSSAKDFVIPLKNDYMKWKNN